MFNTNTPRICRTHPFTNQCCPELYQCMRIIYSVLYNTLLCTTLHNTMWCRALVVERTYAPLCARQGVTNRPQTPRASQAGGRQGCWGFSWEGCCALGSVIIKEIRVAIWGHPRVSQSSGSQYKDGLDICRKMESFIKQILARCEGPHACGRLSKFFKKKLYDKKLPGTSPCGRGN